MITREEYELLMSGEVREAIRRNRERDPLEVALDKRVAHASLVATQVKCLQRARRKLPSYAAAECILPPRAYEQASSEAVAAVKRLSGDRLLDLTCGLGVDSYLLSRRFREVVAVERDPVLVGIARENFRRLGVENVRVVQASAEEFLAACRERFDWIYVDPDRRDAAGRRQVRLEDCSPDVLALRGRLDETAGRLCVKCSPLFDVDEAFRLLPGCRVEAVSAGDECKELNIYLDGSQAGARVAEAVGLGRAEVAAEAYDPSPSEGPFEPERYRWLAVPDVALQKVRIVCHLLRERCFVRSENGYGFAVEQPRDFPGRVFEIAAIEPYAPKALKRSLKGQRAEILKHDFPFRTAQILSDTGLREGGGLRLAFTRIDGKNWMIRLK